MATKPDDVRRSPVAALLYGVPIGLLGGLIGLGGAEFRLPVLAGVFGYAARRAVALNLAISLVTVVSALLIRGGMLSLVPLLSLAPVIVAMIAGAVSASYLGTALVHRVSEHLLERVILIFLVVIGTALIVEAFLPQDVPGLLPASPLVRLVAAVIFSLGIGLVSSLLGVAGGELIIPTLVFAFGAGIKTAADQPPDRSGGSTQASAARLLHRSCRPYPDSLPDGGRVGSGSGGRGLLCRPGLGCGAQARAWCDPDRLGGAHLLPLRRTS
jgi:uncharacterized membrane protein YfcA